MNGTPRAAWSTGHTMTLRADIRPDGSDTMGRPIN